MEFNSLLWMGENAVCIAGPPGSMPVPLRQQTEPSKSGFGR